MALFCTKCGTRNETDAAFCDNCGAALKTPAAAQPPGSTSHPSSVEPQPVRADDGAGAVSNVNAKSAGASKKKIFASAALCSLLVFGGVAMYFVIQPPAANNARLLAAAKAGYGDAITAQFKRELCLANMDYSDDKLNVGEYDRNTQAWLNTLVAAGLYSPPVTVNSNGFFSGTLQQYVTTPELAKYREGSRLCIGKDIEIADVIDIEKPAESLGRDSGAPKLLTVRAKLVLQAASTAPWLEKQVVRDAVLTQIESWEYKDKKLQKQIADTFGLRDKQWTTGPAYKAELEKQYGMGPRGEGLSDRSNHISQKSDSFSIASMLSGIFSFGGHPLKGTWRMDTEGIGKPFGVDMSGAFGSDATMTFTSNSLDVGGQSTKCKFEVDGQRVKVIPEGQTKSFIFVMQDKNTALLDMGLMKMRYKRVD